MHIDRYVKIVLTIIAVELLWIGLGILIAWRMTGRSLEPIGTMLRVSEDDRSSG